MKKLYLFVILKGQWLVTNLRSDILKKFEPVLGEQSTIVGEYIFQCNSQRAT